MGGRDGDAAFLFLGRLVDVIDVLLLRETLERKGIQDTRRERGLAMVDVTDGADVHVRLGALKLLCHNVFSDRRNRDRPHFRDRYRLEIMSYFFSD